MASVRAQPRTIPRLSIKSEHSTLRELVDELRGRTKLSQQKLADAACISRDTVARYEGGKTSPQVGYVAFLCRAVCQRSGRDEPQAPRSGSTPASETALSVDRSAGGSRPAPWQLHADRLPGAPGCLPIAESGGGDAGVPPNRLVLGVELGGAQGAAQRLGPLALVFAHQPQVDHQLLGRQLGDSRVEGRDQAEL